MRKVYPEVWNTPEIWQQARDTYPVKQCPTIGDIYVTYEDIVWCTGASGQINLEFMDYGPKMGKCYIESFTHNCGIRSMTSMYCARDEWWPLWLKTIEAFLKAMNYSIVLASDGPNWWRDRLLQYGVGYNEILLGDNNRMIKVDRPTHPLFLYWKRIRDVDDLGINWTDSRTIQQQREAQAIAQSASNAGLSSGVPTSGL